MDDIKKLKLLVEGRLNVINTVLSGVSDDSRAFDKHKGMKYAYETILHDIDSVLGGKI